MRDGFLREVIEKKAAESLDLAADFVASGFSDEARRIKIAVSLATQVSEANAADAVAARGKPVQDLASDVPVDQRSNEIEEKETSEEDEKSASFSTCLLKLARNIVLPATIAAMIAAKARDGATQAEEDRA